MKISTKYLGEIDIETSQLIHFPEGIPAFEEHRDFVVLSMEANTPFYYLQDVRNADLCLLMVDPFIFFPGYRVELKDEQLQQLDSQEGDETVAVFTILTLPEDFKQATTNLMAPVLINFKNKKGLQFIPAKSDYTTKHPLFKQAQDRVAVVKER